MFLIVLYIHMHIHKLNKVIYTDNYLHFNWSLPLQLDDSSEFEPGVLIIDGVEGLLNGSFVSTSAIRFSNLSRVCLNLAISSEIPLYIVVIIE